MPANFIIKENLMKVELINYTSDALDTLLATKEVRLSSDEDVSTWSNEKKAEHLAYMRDTIHSSWEFVDYTFRISGVSRAFTHQFVRTRTGSYAQQAQRVADVRDQPIVMPPSIANDATFKTIWERTVSAAIAGYAALVDAGAPIQDARGLLPTATSTTIVAKFNLRTLHDMALVRLCTRTQGEYQDVFRAMKREVVAVHPWADEFIYPACVDNGACAFPRYGEKECPVFRSSLNPALSRAETLAAWESVRYEAAPVVRKGMAQ
jgi:flavin-dependent thymidylate synthase